MKVTKATDHSEPEVVGGMAVHPAVVARLAQAWPTDPDAPGLFPSTWANLIAGWCVRHFLKHGRPPDKALPRIARRWAAERKRDPAVQELIERFIASLPDATPDDINPGYVLEVAAGLIDRTRADRLLDELQVCRDTGRLGDFFAAASAASQVNVASSGYVTLGDEAAIDLAYSDELRGLLRPKGDLGVFFGHRFCRASFVVYMGPEKSGKSSHLIDVAYRALKAGRRVAVFQAGDLTQGQTLQRFASRAGRRPLRATKVGNRHEPVKVPKSAAVLHGEYTPRHVTRTWDLDTTAAEAKAALKRSGIDYANLSRLVTRPSKTLTVKEIRTLIGGWARDGWHPDFVVIDYADLLVPAVSFVKDVRHGIDDVWQDMNRLRQEFNCAVVTASQTRRGSRLSRWMQMEDVSEDKRKLAHVTAAIGLNQTPEEKAQGVTRMNVFTERDGMNPKVAVAGCRAFDAPTMFAQILDE